jgi:hypothetical protein
MHCFRALNEKRSEQRQLGVYEMQARAGAKFNALLWSAIITGSASEKFKENKMTRAEDDKFRVSVMAPG